MILFTQHNKNNNNNNKKTSIIKQREQFRTCKTHATHFLMRRLLSFIGP